MSSTDSTRRRESVRALVESIPWRLLVRDLLLVATWIVAITIVFRLMGWPTTLYYLVVFGGVLGYSLVSDPWSFRGDS